MLNYREALADLFIGRAPREYGPRWDSSKPTIAVVLDEFSTQCFRGVANIVPIGTQDIDKALDFFKPSLLLCESAWRGNDYAWRYKFARNSGPDVKVQELVRAARARGIPSVFWNKEDPPHFDEFKETAAIFDYILTTEASVVEKYTSITGQSNVFVLPFAAEPEIHTPRRIEAHRSGEVAFAGQYFAHKFPERRTQMDYLFPAAAEFNFDIFSREQNGDPNYQFPDRFQDKIRGSLPYEEMVRTYRRYKIFLNVNSVPQSDSMCARRIFELSACKTLVLSSPSNAISRFYPNGEVLQAANTHEARQLLDAAVNDESFYERTAHRAWRVTMRRHTYADRLEYILRIAGTKSSKIESPSMPYDERGPVGFPYVAYVDTDAVVSDAGSIKQLINDICEQSIRPVGVAVSRALRGEGDEALRNHAARRGLQVIELDGHEDLFAVSFVPSNAYGPAYAEDFFLSSRQQPEALFGKTELLDGRAIEGCQSDSAVGTFIRGTVAARRLDDLVDLYELNSTGSPTLESSLGGYSTDRFNCVARTSSILENNDWKI